jgi:hypothetical protein
MTIPTHAMREPAPSIWAPDPVSKSGTFLKVGSVVPISVLNFDDTGPATGLVADPTVTPPEIAAWAKAELKHIKAWKPGPDPVSPHCGHTWLAPHGGQFVCTVIGLESCTDGHTAHGPDGDVVATLPVETNEVAS